MISLNLYESLKILILNFKLNFQIDLSPQWPAGGVHAVHGVRLRPPLLRRRLRPLDHDDDGVAVAAEETKSG